MRESAAAVALAESERRADKVSDTKKLLQLYFKWFLGLSLLLLRPCAAAKAFRKVEGKCVLQS